MSEKNKKQDKKAETKVSDKQKVQPKEEAQQYTITATLIDVTDCEECPAVAKYKKLVEDLKGELEKKNAIIDILEEMLNNNIELDKLLKNELVECMHRLFWTEHHLGFFNRRKYLKEFKRRYME